MPIGYDPKYSKLKTDAKVDIDHGFIGHYEVSAAKATPADTDGVLAAVTDNGAVQEITEGFTQLSVPRNITATAGGTATDIGAIQVTVEGTNFADEPITETLPAFTVDTAGTVSGIKAFKTITKVTIPAHDGTGATTAIGFGEVLGIPFKLSRDTVLFAHRDSAKEGTAPTVNVSPAAIEDNTIKLNNSLNGTRVDIYLVV